MRQTASHQAEDIGGWLVGHDEIGDRVSMSILGWSVESGTRVSRCWPPSASDSVALISEERDSMLRCWPGGGGRLTDHPSIPVLVGAELGACVLSFSVLADRPEILSRVESRRGLGGWQAVGARAVRGGVGRS